MVVRSDKVGIHDGGDKFIYMEMILGNGERIVFSQENSRYQTVLEPDEVLSICFTGEVNENAFGQWKNNDIAVSVVYSWETGEEMDDIDEELTENKDQDDADAGEIKEAEDETNEEEKMNQDPAEEEGAEKQEDSKEEESEEKEETEEIEEPAASDNPDNILGEDDLEPAVNEAIASDGNFNSGVKDEIKNIGLQEPQEVDVDISSWKIDEKGQIVSPQYVLENTGDTDGIWILSELICKPKVQDTVAVKTDKNGLHDNEEKSVYMELVVGNSEKIVLSQEKTQYKVELKPGEKRTVRFIGEINGNLFETNEDGDIEVTAICTWNLK